MTAIKYIAAALLLVGCVSSDNSTATESAGDTCGLEPEGPWSALLVDWATAERVKQFRNGRIMSLPPTQGYYVTDRVDLVPPPPPHHHPHHMNHRGPYPMHHPPGPHHGPHGPYHGPPGSSDPSSRPQDPNLRPQNQPGPYETNFKPQNQPGPQDPISRPHNPPGPPPGPPPPGPPPQGPPQGPAGYDEWQVTPPPPPGAGKIVNRPPNPYKDQFKPSYPPSSHNPIPVHNGLSDRVDEARPPPPQKQVSETDLYLLGAIEKLVYRVDLMEKRLRKMEENMHYLVVGSEVKQEPCKANFTRIGGSCYYFSTEALNWKNANYACRKVKGNLLEFDGDEKQKFVSGVLADKALKGVDFWTGGLNPGLLWIWSHSAKAVSETSGANNTATIVGEGRCLALIHDPSVNSYVYRGQDCALRHHYVCERDEDKTKLGNEIERVARKLREGKQRKPKIMWTDEEAA